MEKNTNKKSASALIGAAFLMATSAIGPGFLTQTGQFTGNLKGSFGFVILVSVILAAIVQLNVWRVLCVSGMRGQDVANKVLPGLGYVIAFLVVAGGLVFNIGNVGGGALGFNSLLGIPTTYGCFLAGAIAICVFLYKNALDAMDTLTKILGGIMIVVIFVVILIVKPPVGMAVKETFVPTAPMDSIFPAILTLLGGTVGGYITFAGAHRLIDAGITKEENLKEINKSSVMGIGIATIVRILLFLAILGVVVETATLLVLAGALNGLILPITLGVCLIASQKKSIMGENYKHPIVLLILGIIVVVISAYLGITSLGKLSALFG